MNKTAYILIILALLISNNIAHSTTLTKRYGCDTLFKIGGQQQIEEYHTVILKRIKNAKKDVDLKKMGELYGLAGECMIALGNYKKALEYTQQSISIYEKLIIIEGNRFPQIYYDYALVISNIAQIKTALMIDTNEILECYVKTIKEQSRWYTLVTKVNNNISQKDKERIAYISFIQEIHSSTIKLLGHNFSEAAEKAELALQELKKIYPESATRRFEYIETLLLLSHIYRAAQNYEQTIQYAQQALDITEEVYGKNNLYYGNAAYNLGAIYYQLNNLEKAGYFLTHCMDIYEEIGHSEHANIAEILETAGHYCLSLGEYKSASDLYDTAYAVIASSCGEDCLHIYINRFFASYPLALQGKQQEAADLMKVLLENETFYSNMSNDTYLEAWAFSFDIALMQQRYNDIIKDEEDIEEYIRLFEKAGYGTINKVYTALGRAYHRNKEYIKACRPYSIALEMSKKLTQQNFSFLSEEERISFLEGNRSRLESIFRLSAVTNNDGYNEIAKILFDASLLQKNLLLNASVNMAHIIESKANDELKQKMRKLHLMMNSRFGSDEEEKETCRLLEKEIMKEARLYGDYMDFTNYDWQDVKEALGSKDVAIEFVSSKLFNQASISAEVLRHDMKVPYHVHLFTYDTESTSNEELSHKFRKAIEKKLLKHIKPNEHLYFAPAGDLHTLPIEYLQLKNGKRMNEIYQMHRVTSTRQIIIGKENNNHKKSIVLFGGINYNSSLDDMELHAMLATEQNRSLNEPDKGGKLWSYLPNTMKEVNDIASTMASASYQISLYTQEEGVEERMKALSESHTNIIHIATHGYYKPRSNSLSDCGLIFAGANNFWNNLSDKNKKEFDDGVLTASEISRLNLIGTDLVVLSACQTALGEISEEGVFGLQRAFKKAGAQSLLISLWNVDDEATRILMTEFYKNLITGHTKSESLKNAQEEVRKRTFMRNGIKVSGNDPHFWAAFVLVD